jgi:hypothetical protein
VRLRDVSAAGALMSNEDLLSDLIHTIREYIATCGCNPFKEAICHQCRAACDLIKRARDARTESR